ncbi:hypothetical protein WA026_004417 [Henosepilachna vigintioctopunctata]|uniref:Uncharacterized protein n=1 Tax=Henosepilachna vigintioctopunctata TaxID=420089 RepID=A0AAW1V8V9_9CUCU
MSVGLRSGPRENVKGVGNYSGIYFDRLNPYITVFELALPKIGNAGFEQQAPCPACIIYVFKVKEESIKSPQIDHSIFRIDSLLNLRQHSRFLMISSPKKYPIRYAFIIEKRTMLIVTEIEMKLFIM